MPKQPAWVRRRRILRLCRDTFDLRLKTGLGLINLLLVQQASFSEQLLHSSKGTPCFPVLKFCLSKVVLHIGTLATRFFTNGFQILFSLLR